MKKQIIVLMLTVLTAMPLAAQNIIAYTSFEEPAAGAKYTDTGDAATDHALVNNDGQAAVNYTSTGGELGFSAYYTNTLNDVGITDADYIGVTDYYPAAAGSFVDGSKGYQLSDTDGLVTVTLDAVDLSASTNPNLSVYYFVVDDTWETDPLDYLRIWVVADGTDIDLFNSGTQDMDNMAIEGTWNQLTTSLAGYSSATLKFELQCNAAAEAIYIDAVTFYDGNLAPVADAGLDKTVETGSQVTLDGSASFDADGTIASYAWTQLSGTTVTLTDANTAVATFTAPATDGTMTFQLAVTDNEDAAGLDTVSVTTATVAESHVFISEYVEGNSNNKYIEIYNGGMESVNLNDAGYSLARVNNGDGDFTYAVLSDWGSLADLAPNSVIVLAADGHTVYPNPDTVLIYNSPVHFNGNDAVALLQNGVPVDVVGYPTDGTDVIINMTLRRNNSVTAASSSFDFADWTQLPVDDVSGLGFHAGPNAPSFGVPRLTAGGSAFLVGGTALTIQVEITPAEGGTVSSVKVMYGAEGVFTSEAFLGLYTGTTYMGQIPAQTGNTKLEYKIAADGYESTAYSTVIASATPTDISAIHAGIETLDGSIETVRGIITIGNGLLQAGVTKAYIQDASGRGLNLFDGPEYTDLVRGADVTVVGEVDLYGTTVEIKDFNYRINATDQALPAAAVVTPGQANSSAYEGTYIQVGGLVTDIWVNSTSTLTKLTVADVSDTTQKTAVVNWHTTGLDLSAVTVGSHNTFKGVGSAYNGEYQMLIAHSQDLQLLTSLDEEGSLATSFRLYDAYPNPFNPSTTLRMDLPAAGDVQIAVYDLQGRRIADLSRANVSAGQHTVIWNAAEAASGIYLVRVQAAGQTAVQKITLLK